MAIVAKIKGKGKTTNS